MLHMGVPKTGSSALQVALAKRREKLARLGVNYPQSQSDLRAERGQVTAGNGVLLLPLLTHPDQATALDRQLEFLTETLQSAGERHVLFSSETLFGFLPDRIEKLRDRAKVEGYQLHAALYLRNRDSHAWSAYSQNLKRGLYSGTFLDFLASVDSPYRPKWQLQLQHLLDILGSDCLTVMHYESERAELVAGFLLRVLGIVDEDEPSASSTRINRSLSRREMTLLRYLNTRLDSRQEAGRLDDVIQNQQPLGEYSLALREDEVSVLERRFSAEVAWINEQFFGGVDRLRVISEDTPITSRVEDPLSEAETYLLDVIVGLLQRKPVRLPTPESATAAERATEAPSPRDAPTLRPRAGGVRPSRHVLLHAGLPKTGSTALQIAFVRNRDRLAELGVTYPPAATDAAAMAGRLTSGNGVTLLPFLTADQSDSTLLDQLRAAVEGAETPWVLYSSEALIRSQPDRLRELADAFAEVGAEVRILAFVRDIAGHALSSYSEMVKGALLTTTFAEFISGAAGPPRYRPVLGRRLQGFVDAVGRERVEVLRYDSHRSRLMEVVLGRAGINDCSSLVLPPVGVNRSMTADELFLMRHANRRLASPQQGRRVSGAMIARPPMGNSGAFLTPSELDILQRIVADDVAWVNENFLADDPISVEGGAEVRDTARRPDALDPDEAQTLERLIREALLD